LYGDSKPLDAITSQYYLRVPVDDKVGVLAQVAGALGDANIGISSMIQPESHGEQAELILMVHDATHAEMREALARIQALGCVKGMPRLLRVEHFAS
jgi:homoserine dehydrogenase